MQNLAKMNLHATLAVLLSRFSFQLGGCDPGAPATWHCALPRLWVAAHVGTATLPHARHIALTPAMADAGSCVCAPAQLRGPGALWEIHANRLTMQPKDGLPMRCIPRARGDGPAV